MRVIAGNLGGRIFDSKSNSTHPMSEKMRGAIFNSLGDITGLDFLDAYSGSGAISFEAISRGANSAVAVESNKFAQSDIANNIIKLELGAKVTLVKTTINNYLNGNTKLFDVVICDPPYDNVQLERVNSLIPHIESHGILVLSLPPKTRLPLLEELILLNDKEYGDSRLVFYRNNQ